ncbi:response regulator [Roseibium salinum]|uniref:Response regulator transcription factor n=1 Tax=Roseibium salinum TaxID=1604349 RepID=A0ABT3QWW2_9HYPH|nr:response regulator transcription factor [Roseibium sp. DSM 29163]MCX2721412.1 response regulator transcription factor [Roseibium sp. DSM 29163]MDN3721888.1 response regulator transcription factor [Roseibium salinum]
MDASATRPVIAIIDDDADVRATLTALMEASGFSPVAFADGASFKAGNSPEAYDLALIDLRLKAESGLSLAIHIRERSALPIVMLTGVGDEIDKIIGLETGADDYLMKPFNPRELVARIRAVLRRYGHGFAAASGSGNDEEIAFGDKRVNLKRRELLDRHGDEIPLTNAEYILLEYFVKNPDRIIPRTELMREIGSDMQRYVDRTIDVLILRLRRKIENVPSKPVHLQTRRAQGYIFMLQAGGS